MFMNVKFASLVSSESLTGLVSRTRLARFLWMLSSEASARYVFARGTPKWKRKRICDRKNKLRLIAAYGLSLRDQHAPT